MRGLSPSASGLSPPVWLVAVSASASGASGAQVFARLSIRPLPVRRITEHGSRYLHSTASASANETRRHDDAIHGDGESGQGLGSRRDAEPAVADRDGQVQRRTGEGGHHAGRRGAAAQLEGRAGEVLRPSAHGDRRAVRRNQGAGGRLLAVAGEVEGRGDRMAQARPVRRRHRESSCARCSRRRISAPSSRPNCASRKTGCGRRSPPSLKPGHDPASSETNGAFPCN